MIDKVQKKFEDSGVSPVIGVILMVAVTVALVALVTVIVFDIGGDVSESPDATLDLAQNGDDVEATLIRNENVEEIYFTDSAGTQFDGSGSTFTGDLTSGDGLSGTGSTTTISGSDLDGTSGTVNAIAVMSDGSEQVLTSTDYSGVPNPTP